MSKLDKLEGLIRKLEIEVPVERVNQEYQSAYNNIKSHANIDGFRKGKAPITKIKAMYGERVTSDVVQNLVGEAYEQALNEHQLDPISHPDIQVESMGEGQPLKFTAQLEVRPEVSLKKTEKLKVEKEKVAVEDDHVAHILQNMREQKVEYKPVLVDRPAAMGDTVKIDFDGYINNEPLDGGKASDHILELGSQTFIPGFEEGVVGMKVDENREIELKFPDEYHASDIAGKPVLFKVKLNQISEKVYPEIDDEFAKSLSDEYSSLQELKERIVEDIKRSEENRVQEEFKKRLLKALVAENPVEVPQSLHKEQKQRLLQDIQQKMKQQGMNEADMNEYQKKWDSELNEESSFLIQSSFLIDAIAKKHELSASSADVDVKLKDYASQTGIDFDRIKEFYNTPERRSQISYQITEDKVIDLLISQADIKEVEKEKLNDN